VTEWSLVVTSWVGVTAGARHYYGYVVDDEYERKLRVTRPVTEADVGELGYRLGGRTERFDDRDEVLAAAVALWEAEHLGGRLLLGSPVYEATDRRVLAP